MSRPNHLGTRYACWKCGAKYYDLNKPSPTCPKCGADPADAPKVAAVPTPTPKKPRKARVEIDEEAEVETEEEDELLDEDEDTDDIDEDED